MITVLCGPLHSLSVHEFVLDAVSGDKLAALVPGDRRWWSAIHFTNQFHRPTGTPLHKHLLNGGSLSCKKSREKELDHDQC